MLQHLLFELVGLSLITVAGGMLWVARPVEGEPAPFLRKSRRLEVGYALILLFSLAGGLGSMLLGFTT